MTELFGPLDSLSARRAMLDQRKADLRDAARRSAMTAAPQGQMVSGHYVAPGWAQYLGPLFDRFQQGQEQRAIDAESLQQGLAEKQALRDSLAALSGTPGRAEIPPNYVMERPEDQAGVPGIPAVPAPTGADRRAIIANLIDNPAAGTMGMDLLKDDLIQAPIRQENREFRQQEADATRLERSEQAAADRLARAEAAKQRSEDMRYTADQRAEAAREHRDLMRELAAGRRADAQANRDLRERLAGDKQEKPVKLTAAQQKAYDDSDALLGHIDNALAAVKANPDSVGFKTVMPDIALAKLDPEGVQTRAAVAGLSAEKIHQLSGAAVSAAEFARLRPYLPANGDNAATVRDKLMNLRAEVERIKAVHARGPTTVQPTASPTKPSTGSTGEVPAGWSVRTK